MWSQFKPTGSKKQPRTELPEIGSGASPEVAQGRGDAQAMLAARLWWLSGMWRVS